MTFKFTKHITFEAFKVDGKTPRCQGVSTTNYPSPIGSSGGGSSDHQCKFTAKYDRNTHCKVHSDAVELARQFKESLAGRVTKLAKVVKKLPNDELVKLLKKYGV